MYQQMNPMPTIPNYNQFANVYQPTNAYAQQNLTRVTGIEGARAYQMLANSTVALFDNNEDIMYIKTTDGAGFPTIRTFTFKEVVNSQDKQTNDYVTREEFNTVMKQIKELLVKPEQPVDSEVSKKEEEKPKGFVF